MESLVISSPKSQNPGSGIANSSSASTSGTLSSSRPPSPKQSGNEGPSSTSHGTTLSQGIRIIRHPNGSIGYQKHPCKTAYDNLQDEELPNMGKLYYDPSKGKSESVGKDEVLISTQMKVLTVESISSSFKHPIGDHISLNSSGSLESENILPGSCKGGVVQLNNHTGSEHEPNFCPSPSHSVCTGTNYTEAKPSFTNTEISNSCDVVESRKTSMYRGSTGSDVSDESGSSCLSSAIYKPHKANDIRWEAIQAVRSRKGDLDFKHFRVLRRLGCGDIGSVYLSELTGTQTYFAMKVMDKALLASRKKLLRAQTEREILQSLDHPFLPTLYTHFETEKLSCLVMEFCPGGDLHALRQRQPGKHFSEQGARFYVAEVLLALEYLHMLGIIYRDLKPENVLVREDGHIMLSDFDLSLRCAVSPTLVKSSNTTLESKHSSYCAQPACIEPTCVVQPDCIQPACFGPRFFSSKPKKEKKNKVKNETGHQVSPLPELIAEPTNARSMSFVGTHEYLAPEIIKGEGHGSAVDWWTFGIFLYELLFGKTPFKGNGNRAMAADTVPLLNEREGNDINKGEKLVSWVKEFGSESKRLWHIAGPVIFTALCQYSLGAFTLTFAGRLSELDLAAVSVENSVIAGLSFGVMLGMGSALETLCGQAYGAGRLRMLGVYMQRSWVILLVTACLLVPIYIWSPPILVLFGETTEISTAAGKFALWMLPQLFAYALNFPLQKFLQAQRKVMVIAWISAMVLVLHVFFSWLLILKLGWGLIGAAITLNTSWWLIVIGQFLYILITKSDGAWSGFSWLAFVDLFGFVKLSLASAIMLCLEFWYLMMLIVITGHLSNPLVPVDAISICMNINGWDAMIAIGFNAAISVRVSNELGRGNAWLAKLSVIVVSITSVSIGIVCMIVVFATRGYFPYLFTTSEAVAEETTKLAILLGITVLLNSLQPVLSGVAVGGGWQSLVAYINIGCYYIVGLPAGILLGFTFGFGVMGIWSGMIGGIVLQTLSLIVVISLTNWNKETVEAESRIKKWGGPSDAES